MRTCTRKCQRPRLSPKLIAALLLGASLLQAAPASAGNWVRVGPLGPLPVRVTDSLPLSDQGDSGDWVKVDAFSDEFEGNTLDPRKWYPTNPSWQGRQPAPFLADNVQVADGKLQITLRQQLLPLKLLLDGYYDWSSGAVQSVGTILYGYFEAESKPMDAQADNAFFFYNHQPTQWTEIDVYELIARLSQFESRDSMNLHVIGTGLLHLDFELPDSWVAPFEFASAYHVYGLDWEPDQISFYVDGVLVRSQLNTFWHQPLLMNFDCEIVKDWIGLPSDANLPAVYNIEYVRAWQHP